MAPFTFEGAVLPELGADERGVRECSVCAPGFECAHYGGRRVTLANLVVRSGLHSCSLPPTVFGQWSVSGPAKLPDWKPCFYCGVAMGTGFPSTTYYPTEAEARAEFERRCELMRQEAE